MAINMHAASALGCLVKYNDNRSKGDGMMAVTISLATGLLIAILYRLLRHRAIFPGAREAHKSIVWLKMLGVTLFVALFVWIPLTVLENFPD